MNTFIKVFDDKLNYLIEICCYSSFYFKQNYCEASEFILYVDFNIKNFNDLKIGNIIKADDKEGMILYRKIVKQNNAEMICIKGLTLNCILNRRRLLEERIFYNTRIDKIILMLMEENIINAKDPSRNISNLEIIKTGSANFPVVSYFKASTSKNLAENIFELCKLYEVGNKIELDVYNKKFLFKLYKGNDLNNICFNYDTNVLDMEYEESDISMKNLCYIKLNKNNDYHVIGDTVGLNRHEMIVENKTSDEEEVKSFDEMAAEALFKNKTKENVKCDIAPDLFYVYKKDYKLGDVITILNKEWKLQKELRIEEIEETYDKNDYKLNIVLGEQIPLIFAKIKNKITNLEDMI